MTRTLHILLLLLLLLLFMQFANAQIGIGTASPNGNAILDLTSSKRALLLPRVANTATIINPENGMIIYDLSSNCYKVFQKGAWTGCGLVDLPSVTTLDCSASFSPGSANTNAAYSGAVTSSYTGGNGVVYPSVSYFSSGVTGLTLTLNAGVLAVGSGILSYTVTGTPSSIGVANFSISFLGKTCTKSISVYGCGAYVAAGIYKAFMCHNLGANELLDPNVPVQGMHGNYYQWGRNVVVATESTPAGAISGWNTVEAANGSWLDASKTFNDPCPLGYRVPTSSQLSSLPSYNTLSRVGSWAADGNFTTAISFGPNATTKTLTFPVAGGRRNTDGTLVLRGSFGNYRSSSGTGANDEYLLFSIGGYIITQGGKVSGMSVRCIAE